METTPNEQFSVANDIPVVSQESFNNVQNKDPYVITGIPHGLSNTGTSYGKIFHAPFKCEVVFVSEIHEQEGSDLGAVTLQLERLQGNESLDNGDLLLTTAFDLKASANVSRYGTLTQSKALRVLERGDRLALRDTGTLTSVADVIVTVVVVPFGQGHYRTIV